MKTRSLILLATFAAAVLALAGCDADSLKPTPTEMERRFENGRIRILTDEDGNRYAAMVSRDYSWLYDLRPYDSPVATPPPEHSK